MKAIKMSEIAESPGSKSTDPAPARKNERYAFVDLLRGIALIVMVETHVINAYLPMADRKNPFFFWLSFVNGLVAPSFLFASGFSLVIQAQRRWQDWINLRAPFWKQMRRLGFILLVAYYMHLPHFGLSKFLTQHDLPFWKAAFQVDVLQCIVISLVFANLLMIATRKPGRFLWAAALMATFAALVTPWMWAQNFVGRVPLFLAMFLNQNGQSLFPIFPWISFVLSGCCAGHLFLSAASLREDSKYMMRAFLIAVAGIGVALFLRSIPALNFWNVNFYTTSPLYVAIRIGCVLMICAGLYFLEKKLGWVPQAVRLAGQESLLVYCFHLVLIFSVLRRSQVTPYLSRQLGYAGCFALSAVLIVLMILSAHGWHAWKKNHPRSARLTLAAMVGVNIIAFLCL
jgi:uncharacterized membrane protein